ncbi:MAG: hypothetical protein E6R03_12405 [Hyphomicrobiaceae bacterium]|nr:MAG: hypothetical protein E6R03_12405 [Hyphomicrobiaceae bacterium]
MARTPEQIERNRELCRRLSADPAVVAKRTARMVETVKEPEIKERHREACRKGKARQKADPKKLKEMKLSGQRVGELNFWKSIDEQRRLEEIEKRRAANLSWCPREFWSLNKQLKASKFTLEERKQIILSEVKGTQQHARRQIENMAIAQKMRAEREAAQKY